MFNKISSVLAAISMGASAQTTTTTPVDPTAPGMAGSRPGFVYGMYGQECQAGPAVPDLVCRLPSVAVNEPGNGVSVASNGPAGNTDCGSGYSCCQCERIECGSYASTGFQFCKQLTLGDNAAYGVKDVSIVGNGMISTPNFGAFVACDGIESCANSEVTASYARYISCAGDSSCAGAIIRILPVDGFEIHCSGASSCAGTIFEIMFPPASAGNRCFAKTHGQALQAEHIKCDGRNACQGAQFILNGDVACQREVKVQNIGCNAVNSCLGTKFTGVAGVWNYQEFDCAPGSCMGCTYDNPGAPNMACDPNLQGTNMAFQPGLPGQAAVPLLPGQIII